MSYFWLLGDGALVPDWVANSFPVIKFVLLLLVLLAALSLVVVVMMQDTEGGDSTNVITGIKDTYYSQNGGANRAGRLKRITIILSIFIAVAVIAFFILTRIYGGSLWS